MKKIAILGSTGSIGTQTLEVVRNNPELQVVALAAGKSVEQMEQQIREFHPLIAGMWSEEAAADLRSRVADLPVKVVSGMDGLLEIATRPDRCCNRAKGRDRSYRSSGNDRYPAYHRCHGSRKRHCSGK